MKLAVFGSTGKTGRHVIEQALARGFSVRAMARRPEAVALDHAGLTVIGGDILEPETWGDGLAGVDSVISALGVGTERTPTTVYSVGTANILAAMERSGTRRLAVVSAAPAGDWAEDEPFKRWVLYPILERFYGASYDDMRRMERILAESRINWTVLRPPYLTDATSRGRYRLGVDGRLKRATNISRADLATALLDAIADDRLSLRALAVAS